jgi:two-component system cell cycle sensor histidine kinase PleC
LAAHANLVGPSRHVSLPAFAVYATVMTLTPLQAHETTYNYLALVTPMYVGYIAVMAKQHHTRARIALVLEEEKNALLEELVRSKMESDRARDRAEAASLAKSQFLANMSHELRTPLNAIIGFSELISTRLFKDVEKHYEYAGLIHSSGAHLLTLINDILDLAKIEAGRWRLTEAEIDLEIVAAEMMQLVTWKADENGCTLKTDIAPGLPLLFADGRALKQVWLNLLSNAVKFTHRGSVTAFVRQDADGAILFGVSDTGIGISPEDQVRVFESFGQGQHDVAIADKGTGLGLAIVRGLTEAHGGQASLESELNKGTSVTIRMPVSRARPRELRAIA